MLLSTPEDLKKLIDENGDYILVDCCYSEHEYRRAHIPTSIRRTCHPYVKSEVDGEPGLYIPTEDEFLLLMRDLGISNDSFVIAYDSDGSLFAARFLWTLLYFGHEKVALLNGGWQGWITRGYPVSVRIQSPPNNVPEYRIKKKDDLLVDKDTLRSKLRSYNILDVRSTEENLGSDLRENLRGGKIPGSQWCEWTDFLLSGNTTEEISELKPEIELKTMLDTLGVDETKPTVTYCQGGVRASLVAYILRYLGYQVSVYDGSMKEWANLVDTPLI